jgi:hypothetical protein
MNEITAYVQAQVMAAVRRAITPAAFAIVAGLFVLFTVAALFAALFFWLEPEHGAIAASLICAAAALILALVAAAPLMLRRRPPPPPPQQTAALPQFVSLMARTAPGLGPRQIIIAAALVGAAVVLSARSGRK